MLLYNDFRLFIIYIDSYLAYFNILGTSIYLQLNDNKMWSKF